MSRTGTSVYPASLDSFDRIGIGNYEDEAGYEHTNVHNEAMSGIEKIQSVVGTTAGTSVLKDVLVGQFVATTAGTQTLTNKTLSTGCAVDANADSNITSNSLYRQALINGNFDVWQRGVTATNPASATYPTADRWRIAISTGTGGVLPSNVVHSRQTLTAGDLYGSYYFLRVAPDGAGTVGYRYYYSHFIENGTRFLCGNGKKVTVSFWARSSIANKKLATNLWQAYGTGGSPTSVEVINGTPFSLTSSWAKYTHTFTTNTLASKTFGTANDDYLSLNLSYAWDDTTKGVWGASAEEGFGGSGTIDIAQVQLCAGDVALPFMPKSFAEELRACQRYCFVPDTSQVSSTIAAGTAYSTTGATIVLPLPVKMRIAPDLTATATDYQLFDYANAGIDATTIALWATNQSSTCVAIKVEVGAGLTQYRSYRLACDGTANRLMIFSSEL
jgi:hypothetical protein